MSQLVFHIAKRCCRLHCRPGQHSMKNLSRPTVPQTASSSRHIFTSSATLAHPTTSLRSSAPQRRVSAVASHLSSGASKRMISTTTPVNAEDASGAYVQQSEVRHQKMQSARIFLLNRPKALNSLNLSMIRNIVPQLQQWKESNLCKVIVMTNADDCRAFCSGGDVKTVVKLASSKDPTDAAQALTFFQEEYSLNHTLGTLTKPFVSIMNGITMGGGVGLSVHAPFRIATENTLFAMPETKIGLFPDVGGSFFLPRLDGELGTYLGLTGQQLKGEEVFMAGIATHYIPSDRLPALMTRLAELETDELEVINMVLEEFVADTDLQRWKNWTLGGDIGAAIDRCFKYNNLEEILRALEKENSEWATNTLATLQKMSPLSLKITLEQLRRGRKKDFMDCFRMEYNLVANFLQKSDFAEGVNAIFGKRDPVWGIPWERRNEITDAIVKGYFQLPSNVGNNIPQLKFANGLTYWDYPHRTMSGLPTISDIKRVVHGNGRRNTTLSRPSNKAEVLAFFEQNWGGYDAALPFIPTGLTLGTRELTFEGGYGRGKTGLREKVTTVLDRYVLEVNPKGQNSYLVWQDPISKVALSMGSQRY